jgi:hypothetical protein
MPGSSAEPFHLEFQSEVDATPAAAWRWITSFDGISAELRPLLRMSAPPGVRSIEDLDVTLGRTLFRSRISLFGILPIDHSDLTLVELVDGVGFVEQSPMGSMHLWRHERWIRSAPRGCIVTDRLTIQPRFASGIVRWFVGHLFRHRHDVLRRRLR